MHSVEPEVAVEGAARQHVREPELVIGPHLLVRNTVDEKPLRSHFCNTFTQSKLGYILTSIEREPSAVILKFGKYPAIHTNCS